MEPFVDGLPVARYDSAERALVHLIGTGVARPARYGIDPDAAVEQGRLVLTDRYRPMTSVSAHSREHQDLIRRVRRVLNPEE